MRLPDISLAWPIPLVAVGLIAESETCRLRAYRCPAGVPTIGWGRTDGVQMGMTCTAEQADRWLCEDLTVRVTAVQALLKQHAEPNQLGALVSLAYNIGNAALAKSTVLKAHNAGDMQAAARAFGLWNKARGKGALQVLPGLTARRAKEAALYLTAEPDAPAEKMPQAVEAESSLAKSPIAQGGAVIAATGLGVSDLPTYIAPIKSALDSVKSLLVETLGIPSEWLLPAVLVAVGGVVIWKRLQQRREGWA